MALPMAKLAIRFGSLDTGRAPRNTILGTLAEAVNVRQRKLGRLQKRRGMSKMGMSVDTGSITTGQGGASTPDAEILHADDTLWVRDATAGVWRNRGTQGRAWPTDALGIEGAGVYPFSVVSGTQLWQFSTDLNAYYYRVTDLATGVELKARTAVTAAGLSRLRPVVAGGFVWLFYKVTGGTSLVLHKYDPSSLTTAAVATTFMAKSSGSGVDFLFDVVTTTSGIAVLTFWDAVVTTTGGASGFFITAILNTSTGLPAVSPGEVVQGITTSGTHGAAAWVSYDGTNGSIYFAVHSTSGSNLRLYSIDTDDHGTLTSVWNAAGPSGINARSLSGLKDGSNIYVFLSDGSDASTGEGNRNYEDATVTQYLWNGSSMTSSVFARGEYLASHPFQVGSTWYVCTGHDDFDDAQRSYLVRAVTTKQIVGRALYPRGGRFLQRSNGTPTGMDGPQFHTTATVSGNRVYMSLQEALSDAAANARFVVWDFSHTYGPLRTYINGRNVAIPGAWPARIAAQEASVTELAPMMVPSTPVAAVSSSGSTLAAGVYGFKAVYEMTGDNGSFYTSGESPSVSATISSANNQIITVTVRNLRQTNGGKAALIKLYMTGVGGASYFLVGAKTNDRTVNTTDFVITAPPGTTALAPEQLYTDFGEISNSPPPPARFAFEWRERMWLTGTDFEGEAWASKEYTSEEGPEFSPLGLKVTAYGGRGRIYGGGAVSYDYAVLLKSEGVFAITGAGPDDTGAGGGWQVLQLNTVQGTTNPASICSYPGGCLFQGTDGQIYAVKTDLTITDFGGAPEDLVGTATVVAASHNAEAREVKLRLSTGNCVVLDYGNANANAPDGYWYLDEGAWSAAVASFVHNGLEHIVEADGEVWREVENQFFDNVSTAVLARVKLNRLQLVDLGGEFRLSRAQFVGEFKSAHTFRMALAINGAAAVNYDKTVSASPERFDVRPGGAGRVQEIDITIEERGTGTGEGFWFDGINLELRARDRGARLNSGQRI